MFWKKKTKVYFLLEEPILNDVLGVWTKHLGEFTHIVGYTATGSLFMYSPTSNQYGVFYPLKLNSNFKNYGIFSSLGEFEATILKEPLFQDHGLFPIDHSSLSELEKRIGKLGKFEIYYPKLDPAIGGSLELKQFTKGNVWVRSDILGQNRGIA